ncbi:hypothetical protein CYY_003210 [Polysphondylium violaceum]|uniref:Uncharacterized protein n=1 Tax=Polysphondylium violaceum TaxID=133409 RepID=A0A8J4Q017_9MYCE|nr:hypothetical protein CYY_003210 [Polysphondylium violaceum]
MKDSFLSAFRNVYIRNKIYQFLNERRSSYYTFNRGYIPFHYDTCNLEQIVSLGVRDINFFIDKLTRFKEIRKRIDPIIDSSIMNNDDNNTDDSNNNSSTKQHSRKYSPCYKDWIDFPSDTIVFNNNMFDRVDHQVRDQILRDFLELFQLDDSHLDTIKSLLNSIGITSERIQIIQQSRCFKKNTYTFSFSSLNQHIDEQSLLNLFQQGLIQLKYDQSLLESTLFRKYKDLIVNHYKEWSSKDFIVLLFQSRPPLDLELLVWVLKQSMFNYDICQFKEGYGEIYGLKIKLSTFDKLSLTCINTEILKYILQYRKQIFENYSGRITMSRDMLQVLLDHYQGKHITTAMVICTRDKEQDQIVIDRLKYIGFKFERTIGVIEKFRQDPTSFIRTTLLSDESNIELLRDQKAVDKLYSLVEPSLVVYLLFINNIIDWTLYFNRLDEEERDKYHRLVFMHSIKQYDHQLVVQSFESITNKSTKIACLKDNLLNAYIRLALADNSTCRGEKSRSISIVQYLRTQYEALGRPSVQISPSECRFWILFQDRVSFGNLNMERYNSSIYSFTELCAQGNLTSLEILLEQLGVKDFYNIGKRINDIIINLLTQHRTRLKIKIVLFLFHRFAGYLKSDIINKLVGCAELLNSHALYDILLHRTRVRLFPQSTTVSQERLIDIAKRLSKSEKFNHSDYHRKYPITFVPIPVPQPATPRASTLFSDPPPPTAIQYKSYKISAQAEYYYRLGTGTNKILFPS